MIGLLAVTGMRVGEVFALDRDDVELSEGRLTVRRDKNGKSREIALHPSTVIALERYARAARRAVPAPQGSRRFLISAPGSATAPADVSGTEFDRLRRDCGLDHDTLGRQPACMTCATRSCCARC